MIHNLHINTHRHQSFFEWLFCRHERYSTARQIHKCGKNSLYEINLFLSMCSVETLRKCKANEKYSGRGCHWFFWGFFCLLSPSFFLLLRRWRISEKLFWSWQQLINSELRVSWDQNRTCQRPTREVCLWLFEWPLLFFVHITWSKAQTWQNITRPHAFIASCVKSSMCNDFVLRACRMFNKGLCRLKRFSSFVHCTEMKQNKPEANTIFLFSNNRLRSVISVYINWRCQCILHNITEQSLWNVLTHLHLPKVMLYICLPLLMWRLQ